MGRTGKRGMGFREANYKQIPGYPPNGDYRENGHLKDPSSESAVNLALQVMLLSDALPKQSPRLICS